MNTNTIKEALPAEIDWQDSIMNNGVHRFLGQTGNLNVEIIPDISVTLSFNEADQSVLSVVEQIVGDQKESLRFLQTASQYVREHPNQAYHEDCPNGSISLTQILTADQHAANILHITPSVDE